MSDEIRELRSADEKFPHDATLAENLPIAPIEAPKLKPHRLDAYQLGDAYSSRISFGMNGKDTAAMLRESADLIERGEYLLQECNILTRAERDDYPMTYLTLVFHQKKTEA